MLVLLRTSSTFGRVWFILCAMLVTSLPWFRKSVLKIPNTEINRAYGLVRLPHFPCEKSVQNLNWVADWLLPRPQGINTVTVNLIVHNKHYNPGL